MGKNLQIVNKSGIYVLSQKCLCLSRGILKIAMIYTDCAAREKYLLMSWVAVAIIYDSKALRSNYLFCVSEKGLKLMGGKVIF